MRDVKIHKVMNGYIVDVGCQRLAFESKETLLLNLHRYLNDPIKVEKEFIEMFGMEGGAPTPGLYEASERCTIQGGAGFTIPLDCTPREQAQANSRNRMEGSAAPVPQEAPEDCYTYGGRGRGVEVVPTQQANPTDPTARIR